MTACDDAAANFEAGARTDLGSFRRESRSWLVVGASPWQSTPLGAAAGALGLDSNLHSPFARRRAETDIALSFPYYLLFRMVLI